jgi:predicted RNase H-like HicB family nuclease
VIKRLTYRIWQEDDQFVSQCLDVQVTSCGDSYEEALANLQEAVELYFEDDFSEVILSEVEGSP